MSKFISQKRIDKKIIENVLGISVEAKAAKHQDFNVINATSGTYYDDDGNMHVFKCVDHNFKNCDYNHDLTYSGIIGPKEMSIVIPEHIFGDDVFEEFKDYKFHTISTMGGTGAITMAFCNYSDMDTYILLPSIRWPSYYQIADNHNLKPLDYILFDEEGHFNFQDLDNKIEYVKRYQDKIQIVINDPCQNPTGYSMSKEEYLHLVQLLNEKANDSFHITLLLDIAYLDYGRRNGDETRDNFKLLKELSDNVQVLFAFSASKTFGIYGLRLGALVNMSKNEQEIEEFINVTKFFARATWSNPNHFAVNLVCDTFFDNTSKQEFLEELRQVSNHLIERGTILTNVLDEYNVPYTPYRGGFFVFINYNDVRFLNIIKENKVYAIEMNHGLRIAVSSISHNEAKRLGHIIGKAYQEVINK